MTLNCTKNSLQDDSKLVEWQEFMIQAQSLEIDILKRELKANRQLLREALERHEMIFGGIECLRLPSQINQGMSSFMRPHGSLMTDLINGAFQ